MGVFSVMQLYTIKRGVPAGHLSGAAVEKKLRDSVVQNSLSSTSSKATDGCRKEASDTDTETSVVLSCLKAPGSLPKFPHHHSPGSELVPEFLGPLCFKCSYIYTRVLTLDV